MKTAPQIAMVAGEASSDLLAGYVLEGMQQQRPMLQSFGIGGPQMTQRGFHADWPSQKLAVHGYWDALMHYRELSRIRRELTQRWSRTRPDVFVGCDAPDFNLELELKLRRAGVPTVHFISPSIWAWRGERIKKIQQAVDLMLCLFPFEPALYEAAGVKAVYVGHPLASSIPLQPQPEQARQALGLPASQRILAIMPGSRLGEMKRLGPIFIETVKQLQTQDAKILFAIPLADAGLATYFEQLLDQHHARALNWFKLKPSPGVVVSHRLIEASDAVLVASGTATLECALYKKPMVIAYRVAALTYYLMKRMAYLPWIGLPNILLREFAVPEFVQEAAKPEALSAACLRALDDGAYRESLKNKWQTLHEQLTRPTASLAADAILNLVDAHG
jgi:lipid-A-disaccharide synthase